MFSRKGFTLIELLVAATIIGILLVFATIHYRESAAEARWENAKVHARLLANAMVRAKQDYPSLIFTGDMGNANPNDDCPYGNWLETQSNPLTLIQCGYVERSGFWHDNYFMYYACEKGGTQCKGTNPLVCVYADCGARLPDAYKSYVYCVWENQEQEYLDAERCTN